MNLKRSSALLGAVALGALTLAACGSDDTGSGDGNGNGSGNKAAVECAGKKSLKASGASSQKNAMDRFVNAYESACSGYTLNYTSSGSGAGVSEFVGGQTDFGGSDSPLSESKGEVAKAKERCKSDAWNLPTVFGPVAITYNIDGVTDLVLDDGRGMLLPFKASTTPADPIATSVPAPIAMPTSACARAGASLTPSPTIATLLPSSCSWETFADLSSGRTPAKTRSMPSSLPTSFATASASPVIMTTSTPRAWRASTA